jgi:pimeloyl-ACP methyl ester carboxylesterase
MGSQPRTFATYSDATGVTETFLTPELGGGRTVAVLSTPTGVHPQIAWVICHSFGPEHDNLASFDANLARALARAGHAALRFHTQGYGDSELPLESVSVVSHVGSAVDALRLVREETEVDSLGLVGARFGGAVAALAAERARPDALALIHPAVSGRRFLRSLIQRDLGAGLSLGDKADRSRDPEGMMDRTGILEVEGFPVAAEAVQELERVDLETAMSSYQGRSFVLQVSRSNTPNSDMEGVVGRLRRIGSECTFDIVADRDALRLGLPPWRLQGRGKKANVQADLMRKVIQRTAAWCSESVPGDRGPTYG